MWRTRIQTGEFADLRGLPRSPAGGAAEVSRGAGLFPGCAAGPAPPHLPGRGRGCSGPGRAEPRREREGLRPQATAGESRRSGSRGRNRPRCVRNAGPFRGVALARAVVPPAFERVAWAHQAELSVGGGESAGKGPAWCGRRRARSRTAPRCAGDGIGATGVAQSGERIPTLQDFQGGTVSRVSHLPLEKGKWKKEANTAF